MVKFRMLEGGNVWAITAEGLETEIDNQVGEFHLDSVADVCQRGVLFHDRIGTVAVIGVILAVASHRQKAVWADNGTEV